MKTKKEIETRIIKLTKDLNEFEEMHCEALARFKDGSITVSTLRQTADEIEMILINKKNAESGIKSLKWAMEVSN